MRRETKIRVTHSTMSGRTSTQEFRAEVELHEGRARVKLTDPDFGQLFVEPNMPAGIQVVAATFENCTGDRVTLIGDDLRKCLRDCGFPSGEKLT